MQYFTTGHASQQLKVSVSTIKRWIITKKVIKETRNSSGFILISQQDITDLQYYMKTKSYKLKKRIISKKKESNYENSTN